MAYSHASERPCAAVDRIFRREGQRPLALEQTEYRPEADSFHSFINTACVLFSVFKKDSLEEREFKSLKAGTYCFFWFIRNFGPRYPDDRSVIPR